MAAVLQEEPLLSPLELAKERGGCTASTAGLRLFAEPPRYTRRIARTTTPLHAKQQQPLLLGVGGGSPPIMSLRLDADLPTFSSRVNVRVAFLVGLPPIFNFGILISF